MTHRVLSSCEVSLAATGAGAPPSPQVPAVAAGADAGAALTRLHGKIGHFSKDCPRSRKNMKKLMKDPNYIQAWFGTSNSILDDVLIEHTAII